MRMRRIPRWIKKKLKRHMETKFPKKTYYLIEVRKGSKVYNQIVNSPYRKHSLYL